MRSMLYCNAHLCVIISKFVSFVFTSKTTLFKMFYQRTLLKIPDYTVSYTFHFFFFNATGWQEFSLSIRRFLGKAGKMEAKKEER